MCLCYIHETLMFPRAFLSEWICRHGYLHGNCMNTLTRINRYINCIFFINFQDTLYNEMDVFIISKLIS